MSTTDIPAIPNLDDASGESTQQIRIPASRSQKILRGLGWAALAVTCLLLFTVLKLPEVRLKNYIQGMISQALAPQGISFSAAKSSISLGFGVSYKMSDVTITLPPPQPAVKIEKLEVSPSILPMIWGKTGGKFWVQNNDGELNGSFSITLPKAPAAAKPGEPPAPAPAQEMAMSFHADKIDLGRIGLLPIAAGISGGLVVSGEASVSGNLNSPDTLNGAAKLNLSKITIDPQTLMGFSLPKISMSEGLVDVTVGAGKVLIKSVKLGKPGNASDDLIANLTGDMTLAKQWAASTMSVKARFSLSQNLLKSFSLIDALLTPGKQADGSYAYDLTGPIQAPNPVPVKAQ